MGEIFEKDFKIGFDLGWQGDIPRFTPDDWKEFLILASKLWRLEITKAHIMTPLFDDLYHRLDKNFLEKSGHLDPRLQIPVMLTNMLSPFGAIDLESGTLIETVGDFLNNRRVGHATKERLLAGLALAQDDPMMNISRDDAKRWSAELTSRPIGGL